MLFLQIILKCVIIIVTLLISVAYVTLAERKIMGAMQRRRGPNVVGAFGLLQPLADGLKLFSKEIILPSSTNKILFLIGSYLTFMLSFIGWAFMPYSLTSTLADIDLGLLWAFSIGAVNVYGIMLAGWSSNSKYAFIGAIRSTSQMISYEISLGFCLLPLVFLSETFTFNNMVITQYYCGFFAVSFFPLFLVYFLILLAETNRHPFDLPEAETELVSGYNTEYSGMAFALFFLGEYANILFSCSLMSTIFWGGWLPIINISFIPLYMWFALKVVFFVFLFILARALVPRYRYDQLMKLNWKVFFPAGLFYTVLVFVCVQMGHF